MSLHQFSAIPKKTITLLTPRRTPAVSTPYGNSNSGISVFSSYGFQKVSNKDYILYTHKLYPDIVVALADMPYGSKPGTKRLPKMANRTKDWVGEMLQTKTEDQAIFAPVLPIDAKEQADYLNYISNEAADNISGIAFYDSKLLLDIPTSVKISHIARLSLDEPSSPLRILEQISLGMDLFTVPFIESATDAGIALTFQFPGPLPQKDATMETDLFPLGIDMWSSAHSCSLDPIVKSCCCYCCKFHHQAYVQHLLSTNEMLGWVLLQIHNHRVLFDFFTSIRKSISEGRFETDLREFSESYRHEWLEMTRQAHRTKGNNFNSESPSQPTKNHATRVKYDVKIPDQNEKM